MKMKNYLVGLMMLVIMASMALAITMPHPIYGTVTTEGNAVDGLEVRVKNLDTGANAIVETGDTGFYQADLGNIDDRYHDGDVIQVSIVYCESFDRCKSTVIVAGGGNKLDLDIATEDATNIPDDATIITKYVCPDGTMVLNKEKCIAQVIQTECADGTMVDDEADCPEKSNSWIAWVIGILCVLFGSGGWKIYNGVFKHYHRGIKSYHDPNTQHSNEKYRHVSFKEDPIKCMSQVAKIQKGIDLTEE